ncbi:MAG: hypothetical protein RL637_384 [Pseudomonadota bacterium]|jgi:two-component system sensor histidine kinase UhpB
MFCKQKINSMNSHQTRLQTEINLRIIRLLLIVLTISSAIFIWQTRLSVQKETRASMDLAAQLLQISLTQSVHQKLSNANWLSQIRHLKPTRHFKIHIRDSANHWIAIATPLTPLSLLPPSWFINLMKIETSPVMYSLMTADKHIVQILIESNSPDEITEAWQEIQTFILMLIGFSISLLITVHLIFKQVLQAVSQILIRLTAIQKADYQKLPRFSLTEFHQIAEAVNQLMDSLQDTQQQNRQLSLHLLTIQELERRRLAMELHDEFSQSLTAIKTLAIAGQRSSSVNQLPAILTTIIEIAEQMFAAVRLMMKQLHPLILTELGLIASLQDLVQSWKRKLPELNIDLKINSELDQLDHQIAIHVFRIIQESITNTVRHAQAQYLIIELIINHHQLTILIKDNGIGNSQLKFGFGLLGMQSRILSLNGSFNCLSIDNQGTQLIIQLPLKCQPD